MKAAGIPSQSALARASSVPQPTINRILKGVGKKGPEAHTLAQLAMACNVTFEWLHEGIGSMERTPRSDAQSPELEAIRVRAVDDDSDEFVYVPMIEMRLQAGIPGFQADPEFNEGMRLSLPRTWIDQKRLNPSKLIAMKVKGDSMYPSLKDGATVIVNTADREKVDGSIYAINYDGKALIKRLERDAGTWYLASDNPAPEFRRRTARDNETMIVGRVVRMETDFI